MCRKRSKGEMIEKEVEKKERFYRKKKKNGMKKIDFSEWVGKEKKKTSYNICRCQSLLPDTFTKYRLYTNFLSPFHCRNY